MTVTICCLLFPAQELAEVEQEEHPVPIRFHIPKPKKKRMSKHEVLERLAELDSPAIDWTVRRKVTYSAHCVKQ